MKRCVKCGIEKPEDTFELYKKGRYRRTECRDCRTVAQTEWRAQRKVNPPQNKYKTKQCNTCQEVKAISEFSPASPGYFHGRCKACWVIVDREKRREQCRNNPTSRYFWPFENEAGVIVKMCMGCFTEKPLSEFYRNGKTIVKGAAKGEKRAHDKCKVCDKAIKQADYEAHPEKHREIVRKSMRKHPDRTHARFALWCKENPEKALARGARRRARKRNAPIIESVDRRAIIERDKSVCYLCLQVCTPLNVTLDHLVPLYRGGSHAADNLRVACRSCNSSKGTKLLGEFLK